ADTAPPRGNVPWSSLQTPAPRPPLRVLLQPVLLSHTLRPAQRANTSAAPPCPKPEKRALDVAGQSPPLPPPARPAPSPAPEFLPPTTMAVPARSPAQSLPLRVLALPRAPDGRGGPKRQRRRHFPYC